MALWVQTFFSLPRTDPEDQIIGDYLYPGTKAKNQDVINKAEKILPGIGAQILKDPSQFVRK